MKKRYKIAHMGSALKRRFIHVALLLIGLAVVPSYVWAFKLTSASAAPTINIGGSFLVNKAAYDFRLPYSGVTLLQTGSPQRGDIVQFRHPEVSFMGIKRVIGLPGETVEFRENRVVVDGNVLPLRSLNRTEFNWVAPVNHIGSEVYDEDGHWISFTPGKGRDRNHQAVRLGPHEYFLVGQPRQQRRLAHLGPDCGQPILGQGGLYRPQVTEAGPARLRPASGHPGPGSGGALWPPSRVPLRIMPRSGKSGSLDRLA